MRIADKCYLQGRGTAIVNMPPQKHWTCKEELLAKLLDFEELNMVSYVPTR